MVYYGDFPTGATVRLPFQTFDSAGASITITGFAAADIEIYKNGNTTQRSSDNGYTATTDFDALTGLHMVVIDTSDNTDAGFFAAGNEYFVAVSAITADAQTVSFWAGTFSIERSGGMLALLKDATFGLSALETLVDGVESTLTTIDGKVDTIDNLLDTEVAAIKTVVDDILVDTGTTLPATLATIAGYVDTEIGTVLTNLATVDTVVDAIKLKTDNLPAAPAAVSDIPTAAVISDAVWDEAIAGHVGAGSTGEALGAAGAAGDPWITALPGAYGAGSAGQIVGDFLDVAVSTLASQASVDTIDNFLDTEIAAIKAKTDSLTFTVGGQVDANVQSVNDVTILGDGSGTPFTV